MHSIFFTSAITPGIYFLPYPIHHVYIVFFLIFAFLLTVFFLSLYHPHSHFLASLFISLTLSPYTPVTLFMSFFYPLLFYSALLYSFIVCAVPCLSLLVAGMWLRRHKVDRRPVRVGFVVDKVAVRQDFLLKLLSPLSALFH